MEMEIRVLGEADRPSAERFLKQQPAGMALRGYMMKDTLTPKYGLYAAMVRRIDATSSDGLRSVVTSSPGNGSGVGAVMSVSDRSIFW